MTDFLAACNLMGLTIGIATFFIIGIFHPVVVKAEYYWGTKCWWVFLIAGIAFVVLSVMTEGLLLSTVAGVIAFSCFWSILEIFEQAKRVAKGWFPANPKRAGKNNYLLNLKQMKQIIQTDSAPAAIGPYSQAVRTGNMLFASGQLGIDPATGNFVEGGVKEQAIQVFKNIRAILSEAGCTMADIVKTTVFLADMADFADVNEVYASQFEGSFPARSAVAVKTLPKNALVEIEVIAVK
jgi:2-iminobutanoate/2-iminopropanoate deaminase